VPTWQEIWDLQEIDKANGETVIAEMVEAKANMNMQFVMDMVKQSEQKQKNGFKPRAFRWSPEIARFLQEKFQKQ